MSEDASCVNEEDSIHQTYSAGEDACHRVISPLGAKKISARCQRFLSRFLDGGKNQV